MAHRGLGYSKVFQEVPEVEVIFRIASIQDDVYLLPRVDICAKLRCAKWLVLKCKSRRVCQLNQLAVIVCFTATLTSTNFT